MKGNREPEKGWKETPEKGWKGTENQRKG